MKMIQAESKDKKSHIDRLLGLGAIMVFIDTRKPAVDVPPIHRGLPQLALNFSYNFLNSDFKITDTTIESTLTFPDGKYFCRVPLEAIYGITSRFAAETIVFPADMPAEMIEKMVQPEPEQGPVLVVDTSPDKISPDKISPDKASPDKALSDKDAHQTNTESPLPPSRPRKKGHLKLVKS